MELLRAVPVIFIQEVSIALPGLGAWVKTQHALLVPIPPPPGSDPSHSALPLPRNGPSCPLLPSRYPQLQWTIRGPEPVHVVGAKSEMIWVGE